MNSRIVMLIDVYAGVNYPSYNPEFLTMLDNAGNPISYILGSASVGQFTMLDEGSAAGGRNGFQPGL